LKPGDWPANFAELRGELQEAFSKIASRRHSARANEFQDTPSQSPYREFTDRF